MTIAGTNQSVSRKVVDQRRVQKQEHKTLKPENRILSADSILFTMKITPTTTSPLHSTHTSFCSFKAMFSLLGFAVAGASKIRALERTTSPYYEHGCLGYQAGRDNERVCTSVDPPDAVEKGYCRPVHEGLDYREIRIFAQNWESAVIEAWILQILLTEVLGVPVTLETGVFNATMDFHDKNGSFTYGIANNYTEIKNSVLFAGNCEAASKSEHSYQPCAHFIPEVWPTQWKRLQKLQEEGLIEKPLPLGVVGHMAWFVPHYTTMNDTSLLTYFGYMGKNNRRKLAETFKRPTTWGDYCTQVSTTGCREPDSTAQRPPTGYEDGLYFSDQNFTGYFRKTEENDCERHPDTCTGHIADFPCGWSSYVEQQCWHLDIGLRSSGNEKGCRGYTYDELLDIIAAANATKSDVIFQWWAPDKLHNIYTGTNTEFQAVGMPLPTLECRENTVSSVERCSLNATVRRGSEKGACGEPPYPLQKVFSSTLFEITKGSEIPEVQVNPVYDVLKEFSLTGLHLGELYDRMLDLDDSADLGLNLRRATCEWVVENWALMETFIPSNFPRVPQENERINFDEPLFPIVLAASCLAGGAVLLAAIFTFLKRKKVAIKRAQVDFLSILIVGLLLLAGASVLEFLPPSKLTCKLTPWLVNLGYTLELVPLMAKVVRIQKLENQRPHIVDGQIVRDVEMPNLYASLLVVCLIVVAFLSLWTVLDPLHPVPNSKLTNDKTSQGKTIVLVTTSCESDEDVLWRSLEIGWLAILFFAASVLAINAQASQRRTNMAETGTLGFLVYTHLIFVILRILTYTMEGEDSALFRSLIYSADVVTSVFIYFLPKFLLSTKRENREQAVPSVPGGVGDFSSSSRPRSSDGENGNVPRARDRLLDPTTTSQGSQPFSRSSADAYLSTHQTLSDLQEQDNAGDPGAANDERTVTTLRSSFSKLFQA